MAFHVFDRDENNDMELDDLRFVLNNLPDTNQEEIEDCLRFYDIENRGKLKLTRTNYPHHFMLFNSII
jgi:Ca2+-binding EF-hand superfamily protein